MGQNLVKSLQSNTLELYRIRGFGLRAAPDRKFPVAARRQLWLAQTQMRLLVMKRLFTILAGGCLIVATSNAQRKPVTLIQAGHLVEVVSGKVLDNQMILVEGDIIKEVGPAIQAPANAIVLSLASAWVLPGLIDCHTHITSQNENYYDDTF